MARHHPIFPRIRFAGGSGPGPDPDPEPGDFDRTASTETDRSAHSGHSLTEAYTQNGPYPHHLRNIALSVLGVGWDIDNISTATVGGSSLQERWDDHDHPDFAANDALMITEAGVMPALGDPVNPQHIQSLDYLCRFVASQVEDGAGNDVILWSIWPYLGANYDAGWGGTGFRDILPEYGKIFKYFSDYVTWKMRQLYPALPEDWRVWIFPGHKFMERVYDDIQNDLIPGITDIQDLFIDGIHPNVLLDYGLASFVFTMLYQIDLRDQQDVYIQPAFEDWDGPKPAVPQELAEYFWQIAWEIATAYEPAGMGGTEDASMEWQPSDGDPMPNWTLADPDTGGGGDPDPDPEPGDLPEFVFTAAADDLTDLTGMTGTQPTVEDGVLKFTGGELLSSPMELTDRYVVVAIKCTESIPTNVMPGILALRDASAPGWLNGGAWQFNASGFNTPNRLIFMDEFGDDGTIGSSSIEVDTWYVAEFWSSGLNSVMWVDGIPAGTRAREATLPISTELRLFPEGEVACEVAAIGICDYVPDAEGRAAARAWAQAAIPE